MTYRKQKWIQSLTHPSDEELLSYLDGELSCRQTRRVKEHLESCWACRVRLEKIEAAISDFMRFEEMLLDRPWKPPSEARSGFEAKLASRSGQDSVGVQPRLLFSLTRSERSSQLKPVLIAIILALTSVAYLELVQAPAVSAGEVIQFVKKAEARRESAPDRIVHQVIQVRQKKVGEQRWKDAATVEIWRDRARGRVAQRYLNAKGEVVGWERGSFSAIHAKGKALSSDLPRTSPISPSRIELLPIIASLRTVFDVSSLDWHNPLSIDAFQILKPADEVEKLRLSTWDDALVLKAEPAMSSPIIEVRLVVRTKDWHPVAQNLLVQESGGACEYELTERAFRLLGPQDVGPEVFLEPVAIHPAKIPTKLLDIHPPRPAPSEILGIQVQALYLLHCAGACLGEPIEVVEDQGSIEIRGLVDTAERKGWLIASLARLKSYPFVLIDIKTVDEALLDQQPAIDDTPNGSQLAGGVQLRAGEIPIQDKLRGYFFEQLSLREGVDSVSRQTLIAQRIAELTSEVVSSSQLALTHAWALRRLAEHFSLQDIGLLKVEPRWLVEIMAREHVSMIREQAEKLYARLQPILGGIAADTVSRYLAQDSAASDQTAKESFGRNEASWTILARELFGQVEEQDRWLRSLFTDSESSVPIDEAVAELLECLASVKIKAGELERMLTEESYKDRSSFNHVNP